MSSPITLLALPSELIEAILVCSRSPRTVAAIAQTSRKLRTLIYLSPDSHLWRELFLTTWDDPRPALEHRALVDPRVDAAAWNWAAEYRRRISADRWLKAWRRDVCHADNPDPSAKHDVVPGVPTDDSAWRLATLSALSAVLDTLLTLQPFPLTPPIVLTVPTPATVSPYPTGNVGSGFSQGRARMSRAPPLPPLLLVLATGMSPIEPSRSGVRVARMVYGPHASAARALGSGGGGGASRRMAGPGGDPVPMATTTQPLPIPTPSLPPQLVRTLLASRTVGVRGLPSFVPHLSEPEHWEDDALWDVFHRIICTTGFVPIPPPLVSASSRTATTTTPGVINNDHTGSTLTDKKVQTNLRDGEDGSGLGIREDGEQNEEVYNFESGERSVHRAPRAFPTPSEQHADARILARRRVYDMQYLRGDRMWGPFQMVTRASRETCFESCPGAGRLESDAKRHSQEAGKHTGASSPTPRRQSHRLGTLAWAMGMDVEPEEFEGDSTSDDSSDADWRSGQEASASFESGDREGVQNADADRDMEPTESQHPLISLILTASRGTADVDPSTDTTSASPRRRTRRSNPRLPSTSFVSPHEIKSQHLRPDYTYLASVRIVVEANLRELFGRGFGGDADRVASEAMPGGVGMFWEDEDEILRARARSSEPGSSLTHIPLSSATTSGDVSADNQDTHTLELPDVLAQFESFEVARLGSTCGYWGGWIRRQSSAESGTDGEADVSMIPSEADIGARKPRMVTDRAQLESSYAGTSPTGSKGKGKEKEKEKNGMSAPGLGDWETGPEGEACDGWDWAGVSGIWRRCVCWMDYRELLFFNLDSSKFLTVDTQEACRIIPMELQITGYTRAELMPVYDADEREKINVLFPRSRLSRKGMCKGYFRPPPVIHFSGSSVGSDRGMEDGRKIRGSVHLIGGGEVRWQMDTYTQESEPSDSSMPEWSSEAVQVGGIGSAIGLLGMWTGAGHERTDPLGPFWAWKVT